jgi:hypothetical protein
VFKKALFMAIMQRHVDQIARQQQCHRPTGGYPGVVFMPWSNKNIGAACGCHTPWFIREGFIMGLVESPTAERWPKCDMHLTPLLLV